ncbi:hypothetical protein PtB15_18B227 [Puccinia triticina]|nr:hypothetical protein PtB15_18B227 [Puccinia triticina]
MSDSERATASDSEVEGIVPPHAVTGKPESISDSFLALAAPSFIADAAIKEPSDIEPDVFRDWPSLTPLPATFSDHELRHSFLDPHSSSFYPRDDIFHTHEELLFPYDSFFEGSMGPAFSEQTKAVPESIGIGSPSGEPVNSMIANEANSYKGSLFESWVPALPDYSKLVTGSIGSASGERVNSMIGNHANAHEAS